MKKKFEHYTSLSEACAALGANEIHMKTSKSSKLRRQQEQFLGTCPVCNCMMKYVHGSNVLVCSNDHCEGYARRMKDGSIKNVPVYRTLNKRGQEIGQTLFE